MGTYNVMSNNCQDFCKKLAKKLGLDEEVITTLDAVFTACMLDKSLGSVVPEATFIELIYKKVYKED